MWKFLGKKFGRSSGASVARSTGESVADLRGKYYLEKVSAYRYDLHTRSMIYQTRVDQSIDINLDFSRKKLRSEISLG